MHVRRGSVVGVDWRFADRKWLTFHVVMIGLRHSDPSSNQSYGASPKDWSVAITFISTKPPLVEPERHHTFRQPLRGAASSDLAIFDNSSRVIPHLASSSSLILDNHWDRAAVTESPEACPMYVPPLWSRTTVYSLLSVIAAVPFAFVSEFQISLRVIYPPGHRPEFFIMVGNCLFKGSKRDCSA